MLSGEPKANTTPTPSPKHVAEILSLFTHRSLFKRWDEVALLGVVLGKMKEKCVTLFAKDSRLAASTFGVGVGVLLFMKFSLNCLLLTRAGWFRLRLLGRFLSKNITLLALVEGGS